MLAKIRQCIFSFSFLISFCEKDVIHKCISKVCTDVQISLRIEVVSHYNGYLDRLSCRRGRGEVTYFFVGTFFVYILTLSMPIFKKKSSRRFLGESSKHFIVVTLLQWKVWNFLPEISTKIFSWKLAYIVPKRPPNIEVCNFIPAPLRALSIKQVIVVLY